MLVGMTAARWTARTLVLIALLGTALVAPLPARVAVAAPRVVVVPVPAGTTLAVLPLPARRVVVSWAEDETAAVAVAFSRDGVRWSAPVAVRHDEILALSPRERTFSLLMSAQQARFVRIDSDRALRDVEVLAVGRATRRVLVRDEAQAAVPAPAVRPRSAWGANEALRATQVAHPVQKLVVHHTVSAPGAGESVEEYIRDVQAVHARELDGDIGYHLLIDRYGRVFEGRYSADAAAGLAAPGETRAGSVVRGAHVGGTNSGLLGVAMIGDFTARTPTGPQRDALVGVLASYAERHGLPPTGSTAYVPPGGGTSRVFPNIAGHREAALPSGPTACPGDAFFPTLPSVRSDVAARIGGSPPPSRRWRTQR
jgi:hypothetical protein